MGNKDDTSVKPRYLCAVDQPGNHWDGRTKSPGQTDHSVDWDHQPKFVPDARHEQSADVFKCELDNRAARDFRGTEGCPTTGSDFAAAAERDAQPSADLHHAGIRPSGPRSRTVGLEQSVVASVCEFLPSEACH